MTSGPPPGAVAPLAADQAGPVGGTPPPLAAAAASTPTGVGRATGIASTMFVGRAVAAYVIAVVSARALGPAGRGQLAFVTNVSGLCALGAAAGTASVLTALRTKGATPGSRLRAIAVGHGLVLGTLTGAGLVLLQWLSGGVLLSHTSRLEVALLAVTVPPLAVLANVTHVLTMDGRIDAVSTTSLAGVGLNVLAVGALAVTGHLTTDRAVVAWAVGAVVPLVLLRPAFGPFLRSGSGLGRADSAATVRRALASGLPAMAVLAVWRVDVVIVNARRGFAEVGLYSAAVSIAEIVLVGAIALRHGLLAAQGSSDREGAADAVCRGTRITLAVLAPATLALAGAASLALRLSFGAAFADARSATWWLLPGVVLLVLHYPMYDYLLAEGRTTVMATLTLTLLAGNVGANLVLLGRHGYVAAAITSTATYALLLAACAVLFTRHAGRSLADLFVVQPGDLRRPARRPARVAP